MNQFKALCLLGLTLCAPVLDAGACAVCYNASSTPIGPAVTNSIFVLLGILFSIFACFAWFIFQQVRRSKESPFDYIEPTQTKHAR
ncbi:MAG TPA: hypothetical protein VIU12_02960 [Chryseolinea sp.]